MTKYWAAAANPEIYNIESAINSLEVDLWTTRNSDISKSDRLIIWKTLGKSERRGIISLGEVIDYPIMRTDSNNPFWVDQKNGNINELRCHIKYIKSPKLPLWIDDSKNKFLGNLSVARAQGGTIFKITEDQWNEILSAIGGWPE
jgi:hypothetical protein